MQSKQSEVQEREGAYNDLQERSKAAERAVQTTQQHFQAVTAGLSSGADGQDETLAAQKIGSYNYAIIEPLGTLCQLLIARNDSSVSL